MWCVVRVSLAVVISEAVSAYEWCSERVQLLVNVGIRHSFIRQPYLYIDYELLEILRRNESHY